MMSRQANHPPENDGDKTTCTRNRSSTINRQERLAMNENKLLERITANPAIFRGKSIIRGRRLAVEHVLGMLAAGDDFEITPGVVKGKLANLTIHADSKSGPRRP